MNRQLWSLPDGEIRNQHSMCSFMFLPSFRNSVSKASEALRSFKTQDFVFGLSGEWLLPGEWPFWGRLRCPCSHCSLHDSHLTLGAFWFFLPFSILSCTGCSKGGAAGTLTGDLPKRHLGECKRRILFLLKSLNMCTQEPVVPVSSTLHPARLLSISRSSSFSCCGDPICLSGRLPGAPAGCQVLGRRRLPLL